MLSDMYADFLTRIRNASRARLRFVNVFASKIVLSSLEILKREGFIEDFRTYSEGAKKYARVYLKYDQRKPMIQVAQRISKNGRRKYVKYSDLNPVLGGTGFDIITTSSGLMTSDEAKKKKVGGEILCRIA